MGNKKLIAVLMGLLVVVVPIGFAGPSGAEDNDDSGKPGGADGPGSEYDGGCVSCGDGSDGEGGINNVPGSGPPQPPEEAAGSITGLINDFMDFLGKTLGPKQPEDPNTSPQTQITTGRKGITYERNPYENPVGIEGVKPGSPTSYDVNREKGTVSPPSPAPQAPEEEEESMEHAITPPELIGALSKYLN